eukprot:CAMPEP_0175070430 /NCGR_PEP_ID=MMETSP0052_2-20121109/18711_1 /TAXON_ID=51329 ORGANISM="Polytomella parva, Strain SAG 63-3" /NCGR_SAMPLE_ID=MMETSP0052_2 /ASSEMBLY_ACC=CAM_ASM_000194 /LENGTH=799 /DNA_ID=CAMNT_0016337545 /DNA_START=32 /DNA_END=2431 /DNA_ORIENTATION=-
MVNLPEENLIEYSAIVIEDDDKNSTKFSFRKLFLFMGPGLLMSIAYMDPGNLESDLQVGANTGYCLLWVLLATTSLGYVVQMQSAKLGVATGRHLAEHCREQYTKYPRYFLWVMTEIAIIGSDIQEVIGSAIALSLLSGGRLPIWAGVIVTAFTSFFLLFIERLGIRFLEAVFVALIGVMTVSFGVLYNIADVPPIKVIEGFLIPSLPLQYVSTAVALIGSLLMPHNIYLHSALVQTRQIAAPNSAKKREALRYFGIESALSLAAAVVVNLFVVAVFAAGFFESGLTDIGLENAGHYLGEAFGKPMVVIWAFGLLAAGQSSTMTGTYTGQFVINGFLRLNVSPMARVLITRLVALCPTLAVALFCHSQTGLDQLNQSLNLLQSLQLPFALIPVLRITSCVEIMGEFVNGTTTKIVTWTIAVMIIMINLYAVFQSVFTYASSHHWAILVTCIVAFVYFSFIIFMSFGTLNSVRVARRKALRTTSNCSATGNSSMNNSCNVSSSGIPHHMNGAATVAALNGVAPSKGNAFIAAAGTEDKLETPNPSCQRDTSTGGFSARGGCCGGGGGAGGAGGAGGGIGQTNQCHHQHGMDDDDEVLDVYREPPAEIGMIWWRKFVDVSVRGGQKMGRMIKSVSIEGLHAMGHMGSAFVGTTGGGVAKDTMTAERVGAKAGKPRGGKWGGAESDDDDLMVNSDEGGEAPPVWGIIPMGPGMDPKHVVPLKAHAGQEEGELSLKEPLLAYQEGGEEGSAGAKGKESEGGGEGEDSRIALAAAANHRLATCCAAKQQQQQQQQLKKGCCQKK